MRPCAHCEYQNADHLAYCFQCGRRLGAHVRRTVVGPSSPGGTPLALPVVAGNLAVAPTMMNRAMASPSDGTLPQATATSTQMARATPSLAARAVDNVKYFFVYLRGRWAAEERKRRLAEEKEGAERLLGSAFAELGQTILREGHSAPDLTGLLEAIGRAQARREGAIADLRAAEQLQAAEELRQGRRQESAQAAVKAADEALRELDELIRGADQQHSDGMQSERARSSLHLEEMRARRPEAQEGLNRARAQLDEITRERRQTAAQLSVGLSAHSRERAEAERETANLTAQLGQAAHQCQLAVPSLRPALGRIERLETTVADRGRAIAAIDLSMGHYDLRRVTAGAVILLGTLTAISVLLWFVFHHRGR